MVTREHFELLKNADKELALRLRFYEFARKTYPENHHLVTGSKSRLDAAKARFDNLLGQNEDASAPAS